MSEQNHLELGRVILDLPKGLSLSRTVSAMRTPPSVSWMTRAIPSSAAPAPLSARIT